MIFRAPSNQAILWFFDTTTHCSSIPEIQPQIPKTKGINKSNIRNFSLLPVFTAPSRDGTADPQRMAKNTKHSPRSPQCNDQTLGNTQRAAAIGQVQMGKQKTG